LKPGVEAEAKRRKRGRLPPDVYWGWGVFQILGWDRGWLWRADEGKPFKLSFWVHGEQGKGGTNRDDLIKGKKRRTRVCPPERSPGPKKKKRRIIQFVGPEKGETKRVQSGLNEGSKRKSQGDNKKQQV